MKLLGGRCLNGAECAAGGRLDKARGFCYSLASLESAHSTRTPATRRGFAHLLVLIPETDVLEAKDKIHPQASEQFAVAQAQPPQQQQVCVECLEAATETIASRCGETLCANCAKSYYVACARCRGLVPQDEALMRDDAVHCSDCDAEALAQSAASDAPDDAELETLVSEYIGLHAEEKRIKDRLDEIKEQLKAAAAARERVAGAVTLRGEDGVVKCSFKTNLKCDPEKVGALENRLEPDAFAALFERKISYSPVKEQLEKFLSNDTGTDANLRELILAAVERTETPTLTVVRPKK
ncbi:MAG: hypothetical protein QOD28_190 [Acidobacteriota bacterium]|nr:hypothetical protein [Acidobacteriota bacterium]